MKNFEKHIDVINKQVCLKNYSNSEVYGCEGCRFEDEYGHCDEEKKKQWLLEEYQELCSLSHDEYVILKNVDNTYKFICRNACSKNLLLAYGKSEEDLRWCFSEFNHLFTFIKGNEIYEIAKLIADYEKEHENGY